MMNPELAPFLKDWSARWAALSQSASPAERRAHFEVIARAMRMPSPPDVDTNVERWIPSSEGPVRVRLFRYRDECDQPAIIYMHGGAWMQGSPETHWDITSRIASANRQTVISVDYAKAPEHPFPAAVNQCAAVVAWVFDNARALRLDRRRIGVGGDSAGANLAAAMTLEFRTSSKRLHAQLLIYPAVEFSQLRPSFAENAEGPIIRVADMPRVNAMYCPNPDDRTNPLAAPLLAASHAGVPPAYIAVAQYDPLRDDGLAYAHALESAGVPVTVDRGAGLIHGYLRAMPYCADCRERLAAMAGWLRARNEVA